MAKQNFPGPYLNDTKEEDPMMIRRPPNHLEIASRPATLRATLTKATQMGIDHVKDQNSK